MSSDHEPSIHKPIKRSELQNSISDLSIVVDGYSKTVSSYETYVTFYVITKTTRPEYPGNAFQVSRRYSEFDWLQRRLHQLHPALFVPPLPGKRLTAALDRFGSSFINRRTAGLHTFLHRLSTHPVLSSNPDLIAFVTLPDDEFHQYQERHSTNGFLTGLLTPARFGELANKSSLSHSSTAPESAASRDCFIPSSSLQLCSDEFRAYMEETSAFNAIAQRIARVTERISHELTDLATDYSELACCLETWPPELMVESSGKKDDADCIAEVDTGSLRWSRERPKVPVLIAKAVRVASVNASHLSACLRNDFFPDWSEAAAYARTIRDILKSREDLEKEYLNAEQRIGTRVPKQSNDNSSVAHASDLYDAENDRSSIAGIPLPWRRKPLPELVSQANDLQDRLAYVNGQLRVDFERWQEERRQESLKSLLNMVDVYKAHWNTCADAWRDVIRDIESENGTVGAPVESQVSVNKHSAGNLQTLLQPQSTTDGCQSGLENQFDRLQSDVSAWTIDDQSSTDDSLAVLSSPDVSKNSANVDLVVEG